MSDDERRDAEITEFDVPTDDEGFDPLRASAEELRVRGLPARPDQQTQRELYDFWADLVSRGLRYHRPDFSFAPGLPHNFLRAGAGPAITRRQASRNWSGAYITPRDGRRFIDVVGAWQVPYVAAPVAADGDYRSSTWIGLDGQRKYLDSTLPQIGTAQQVNVVAGIPAFTTTSWVQWWPAIPPFTILPINSGDVVVAWLTVLTPQLVYLALFNLTAVTYSPFTWAAPKVPWPTSPVPLQVEVAGATAEWVMERPTIWGSDVLYELPDYFPGVVPTNPRAPVEFLCFAVTAPAPGMLGPVETLVGPRSIRMYRIDGTGHLTQTTSVGKRPDTPGLNVITTTYVPR